MRVFSLLLLISMPCAAGEFKTTDNTSLGFISDGRIYDRDYNYVGRVDDNGYLQDRLNRRSAQFNGEYIVDDMNRRVARIDDTGRVYNQTGEYTGTFQYK